MPNGGGFRLTLTNATVGTVLGALVVGGGALLRDFTTRLVIIEQRVAALPPENLLFRVNQGESQRRELRAALTMLREDLQAATADRYKGAQAEADLGRIDAELRRLDSEIAAVRDNQALAEQLKRLQERYDFGRQGQ